MGKENTTIYEIETEQPIGTTLNSRTYRKEVGCGHIYLTLVFREDKPNRIDYVKIEGCKKRNDCGNAPLEAIADLLSFSIRRIRNQHEADAIIKALSNHRCNRVIPNPDHIVSCYDAIGKVLKKELIADEISSKSV